MSNTTTMKGNQRASRGPEKEKRNPGGARPNGRKGGTRVKGANGLAGASSDEYKNLKDLPPLDPEWRPPLADYEIHPLADIIPRMSETDYAHFKARILADGQIHEPLAFFEGKILDGRHRYWVHRETGLPLPLSCKHIEDRGSALDFALARNVSRRHLTESQRAMIGAKLANCPEGRPEKTAHDQAVSQGEAAVRVGVGRSSVQAAGRVLKKGIPDLAQAVVDGQLTVARASKIAEKPHDEQADLLAMALQPKSSPKPDSRCKVKDPGASVTDTAGGSASPEEGASTPAEPYDPAGPADDGHGREQTVVEEIEREAADVKVDTPPAAPKSSSGDESPHVTPLEGPGVSDPAGNGLINDLAGHLRAAVGVITQFYRTPEGGQKDAAAVKALWAASDSLRETFANVLGASSPRVLAACERCKGVGAIAQKRCPGCGGLGMYAAG